MRKKNLKKRNIIYISIIGYIFFSILVFIPLICKVENSVSKVFDRDIYYEIENIIDIFTILITNIKIAFIWLIIQFILALIVYCIYFTIHKSKIENKGIKFKTEDGTFGTANWMNGEELTDSFEIGTENGIIVGKIDNQIVTLPNNTLQNKNVAIFGASRK